jgi:hypothetical protein
MPSRKGFKGAPFVRLPLTLCYEVALKMPEGVDLRLDLWGI